MKIANLFQVHRLLTYILDKINVITFQKMQQKQMKNFLSGV